ncbi:hypothetical protein, partial [Emiliania huxleyi virus 18]
MENELLVPETKRMHFMTSVPAHDNICRGQIQSVADGLSIIETFGASMFPLYSIDLSTMEKKLSAVMVADVSRGVYAAASHQLNRINNMK